MRAGIVVNVTRADRLRLEAIVADRSAPQKHVWRAKVILATADGCGTAEIMRRSGKSKPVVWTWQGLAARIRCRLLSGADDTLAASDEAVDSASLRSPKKRGPLQAVPVMARAMVERLAEGVSPPRYSFCT